MSASLPLKAAILGSLLATAGCGMAHSNNADDKGEHHGTRRDFTVSAFTAVSAAGPDSVNVVTGPAPSVVAEGPAEELDRLIVRNDGDTLKIERKRDGWFASHRESHGVRITVTAPAVNAVGQAGSGDMTVDELHGDTAAASTAGSGSLSVAKIAAKALTVSVAGSGDARLAGSANDTKMRVAGSGNVDASTLTSQTASISVAGSGDVRTNVHGHTAINIAGSGNVVVRGTSDCAISTVGSGTAHCEP